MAFMNQIRFELYSASLKTAKAPINFPFLSVSGANLESTSLKKIITNTLDNFLYALNY